MKLDISLSIFAVSSADTLNAARDEVTNEPRTECEQVAQGQGIFRPEIGLGVTV